MTKQELEQQCKKQEKVINYLETQIYNLRNMVETHLKEFNSGIADRDDERNIGIIKTCETVADWFNTRIASHTMRCGEPIEISSAKEIKVVFVGGEDAQSRTYRKCGGVNYGKTD